MKLSPASAHAVLGWALVLLSASAEASHSHNHQHAHQLLAKKHHQHQLEKRSTCAFPGDEDPNLVAVTPDMDNAGWAMSPDQSCKTDSYCPYACKPGMVMAQWDPDSTYDYPASMNGGLYCDKDGKVSKPFPSKPYCVDGTGTVKAVNKAGSEMSWCQTVLPGNEAMLIPTLVTDEATIAVPDPSYWCSTAAHFYINPPGVGTEGCVWGDESKPLGNWSPYVAGANTDSDGSTFVKLGWNPIYEASTLMSQSTKFGVKIECPDGGCNGLPCAIEPASGGLVDSSLSSSGAGGADFCVVTVPKGGTAHIVAYTPGGDSGDDDDEPSSTSSAEPSSTSASSTSTSAAPTTSSTSTSSTSTSSTSTSSTSTSSSSTSTSSTPKSTSHASTTSTPTSSPSKTSSSSHKTTSSSFPKLNPGIFQESGNKTESSHTSSDSDSDSASETSSSSDSADSAKSTKGGDDSAAHQHGVPAIVGLFAAFASVAMLF